MTTSKHTHMRDAVTLVWSSLRLAPIRVLHNLCAATAYL